MQASLYHHRVGNYIRLSDNCYNFASVYPYSGELLVVFARFYAFFVLML